MNARPCPALSEHVNHKGRETSAEVEYESHKSMRVQPASAVGMVEACSRLKTTGMNLSFLLGDMYRCWRVRRLSHCAPNPTPGRSSLSHRRRYTGVQTTSTCFACSMERSIQTGQFSLTWYWSRSQSNPRFLNSFAKDSTRLLWLDDSWV